MQLHHIARESGRLSQLLRDELRVSTGLMNRLKWKDGILVNGVAQHTDYAVKAGDRLTLLLDEPEPEYPPEDGELTVLYEDDHLLAVEKPAGMLVHPSCHRDTGTLANLVVGYYRRTGQHSAFHPITRLDRDTFGVVLVAKHSHCHALVQSGPLEKIYHATVWGAPPEEGVIDAPIARLPLPSLLRQVSPEGKPSRTEYRCLRRFDGYSLMELRPITGRTHQLRVHCAHIGHPILGDPQYGGEEARERSRALGLDHQCLCARAVRLPHPLTGEPVTVESTQPVMPGKE